MFHGEQKCVTLAFAVKAYVAYVHVRRENVCNLWAFVLKNYVQELFVGGWVAQCFLFLGHASVACRPFCWRTGGQNVHAHRVGRAHDLQEFIDKPYLGPQTPKTKLLVGMFYDTRIPRGRNSPYVGLKRTLLVGCQATCMSARRGRGIVYHRAFTHGS